MSRRAPAADYSVEVLIDFWDRQVRKLVEAGIPADRIANSLWVAGSHAETLCASDPNQAEEEAGGRPERRGPGRPWSKP